MSVTRRNVLLGAVAAAGGLVVVSGCRDDDEPRSAGLTAEDRAALAAAVEAERRIIAMYEARPSEGVVFELAHSGHVAHLAALRRLETMATPAASPTAGTDGAIEPLVMAGATQLQEGAVAAVDGTLAAVLASVAASHLTPPPMVFEAEFYGRRS